MAHGGRPGDGAALARHIGRNLAVTGGCVLIAVIGMHIVMWYARGGTLMDEEVERNLRSKLAVKREHGRLFGAASMLNMNPHA